MYCYSSEKLQKWSIKERTLVKEASLQTIAMMKATQAGLLVYETSGQLLLLCHSTLEALTSTHQHEGLKKIMPLSDSELLLYFSTG